MKLACPYCGAQIGDGAPMHITPVRYPRVSSATEFKMIDIHRVISGAARAEPMRVIQSCPAEGCKAAALQVQPRVSR